MAAPRSDNVRELIMDATERLMEAHALSDISLARIAREAQVSKGTLYYHYKTKDDILFDITDRYLKEQWDDLLRWTGNPEKDTSLHRLVKYVAERNVAATGMRMHLLYSAMLGNEELRRKLAARYREFASLISEKIAERTGVLDADYLAWLVLTASDGLIVQKTLQNDGIDVDRFIRESADAIRHME